METLDQLNGHHTFKHIQKECYQNRQNPYNKI